MPQLRSVLISMTLDLSAYCPLTEATAVSGHAAICLPLRRGAVCLSTNTKPGRRFASGMLRVLSPLRRGASRFSRRESTVR